MIDHENLDHGDVVTLNSGGPEMTVDYVEDVVVDEDTGETEPSVNVLRGEGDVIFPDAFHPQALTFVRAFDDEPYTDFDEPIA
jgi:hypothetical protein